MNSVTFSKPDLESLRKEFFVVDMHHHTKYSHDSGTPVQHIIDQCEEQQIHVAITDHNTISGVLKASELENGSKWIIPGIEITTKESKDILVYFYSVLALKRFFKQKVKPRIPQKSSIRMNKTTYSMKELLEDLSQEDCLIVVPHPCCARIKSTYHFFRKKTYAPLLKHVHAIEVINETMPRKSNLAALGWAMELGKPITAGSDGHRPNRVGEAVTYARASNKKEFLDAIKEGKCFVQGSELRPNERLMDAFHLVAEKAKIRNNKRLDKEYIQIQ